MGYSSITFKNLVAWYCGTPPYLALFWYRIIICPGGRHAGRYQWPEECCNCAIGPVHCTCKWICCCYRLPPIITNDVLLFFAHLSLCYQCSHNNYPACACAAGVKQLVKSQWLSCYLLFNVLKERVWVLGVNPRLDLLIVCCPLTSLLSLCSKNALI